VAVPVCRAAGAGAGAAVAAVPPTDVHHGNAATFVLGFSMFGAIIYVPLYLQIVKGATPRSRAC